MFGAPQDGDFLARAQEIALGYEYGPVRRQPRRGGGRFVLGVAAGVLIGSRLPRKGDRGKDSGGPQGCF